MTAEALKVGFEYPAGVAEIADLWLNIDPQHGGHKSHIGDAPVSGDCAASWTMRNWEALHDAFARHCPKVEGFSSPKWDVDALVSATILSEVSYALYMSTGAQHFFMWGEGSDGKLKERIELVRRLDSGELGQQLGDHPELIGLARVASSDLALKKKINLCRLWLTGQPCAELKEQAALADIEVSDGISDAVVTKLGAGAVLIVTKTLGQPSRGRGAAQKLGFDEIGAETVIQLSSDWTFPDGQVGPKYTITHKGGVSQATVAMALSALEFSRGRGWKWGGPTPRPDSWILGSPMDLPSLLPPGLVIRGVMAAIGEAAAKSYLRVKADKVSRFRSFKEGAAWFESHWTWCGTSDHVSKVGLPEYHQGVWALLAKEQAAPFMCFCGWEGAEPVVDAQEVAAREMDVSREESAPDRDDSDRLSEAVGFLAVAKSGRCPKCSAKPVQFS